MERHLAGIDQLSIAVVLSYLPEAILVLLAVLLLGLWRAAGQAMRGSHRDGSNEPDDPAG